MVKVDYEEYCSHGFSTTVVKFRRELDKTPVVGRYPCFCVEENLKPKDGFASTETHSELISDKERPLPLLLGEGTATTSIRRVT